MEINWRRKEGNKNGKEVEGEKVVVIVMMMMMMMMTTVMSLIEYK
jgi:hypothetical protein